MHKQNLRLLLYSSLAIVALTLVWGWRQIPRQADLAKTQLRLSVNQEVVMLDGAVRAATSAMKYRLLDLLKSDSFDNAHTGLFAAAGLLEPDGNGWKFSLFATQFRDELSAAVSKTYLNEWPIGKLTNEEVFFGKALDIQGTPYFALITPLRKGSATLFAFGIFPASQFGVELAPDSTRETRVFDDKGVALALAHPAYLGASLKRDPVISEILEGEALNLRREWTSERGKKMLGSAQRISGSNLFVAVEAFRPDDRAWFTTSWLYLLLCAVGAIALNWFLFSRLVEPLFDQLAEAESGNSRREVTEEPKPIATNEVSYELDDLEFLPLPPKVRTLNVQPAPDLVATDAAPASAPEANRTPLNKIINSSLRALEPQLRAGNIQIVREGLENISLESDVLALQTAIEEVLKNSLEAMESSTKRELIFKAQPLTYRVRLTIEDSGPGIAADKVGKVFDPFYSTHSTEESPRGLGLNVVRRVIEEMQGTVALRNRADHSGVIVEIDWPKQKDLGLAIETAPEDNWVRKPRMRRDPETRA